jgi:DNA-binding response OmpR family regulator
VNRILIVEDEAGMASFIDKGLSSRGYATTLAADGARATAIASDRDFDLVVLDLGLPDVDGLSVLRELRRRGERMPVIILTARDDLGDKVGGLDAGASDYVTKPFKLEELLARIRAQLRDDSGSEPTRIEVGGLALDIRTRKAMVAGKLIDLTAREFTMLETFMRHPGQVLSQEQLLAHVWGYDYDPGSNVVEVYVGYLRRKLGGDAIETVRGMGYRLRDADEQAPSAAD